MCELCSYLDKQSYPLSLIRIYYDIPVGQHYQLIFTQLPQK